MSWYLALLVTLGWRAARHGRWPAAGWWLGLAIGLKPFLLLFLPILVIRGRWLTACVSLVTAGGSVLAGAAIFGWPAVASWLALLRTAPPMAQVGYFINASWLAVVARTGLPLALGAAGSTVIIVATLIAARRADEDRAWLLTIVGALLASPLGWIYYTPLIIGPLVVLARSGGLPSWSWWLWPLLAFPPFSRYAFQQVRLISLLPGSMYTWGFVGLWIAALWSRVDQRRTCASSEPATLPLRKADR